MSPRGFMFVGTPHMSFAPHTDNSLELFQHILLIVVVSHVQNYMLIRHTLRSAWVCFTLINPVTAKQSLPSENPTFDATRFLSAAH